jgi:hypothetical protein
MVAVVVAVGFSAGCSSAVSMSDAELAECIERTSGSLGGSPNAISGPALRLPDPSSSESGVSSEDVEAEFDRRFSAAYGISVDEFLALRVDADEATRSRLGEAPRVGELVSDEWFVQRDEQLMILWHERHPQSARTYCDLIAAESP